MASFDTIREVVIPKAEDLILTRQDIESAKQKYKNFMLPLLRSYGMTSLEDYAGGLLMETTEQGVLYNGGLYKPKTAELPFTTTVYFDNAKWQEAGGDHTLLSGRDEVDQHPAISITMADGDTAEDMINLAYVLAV